MTGDGTDVVGVDGDAKMFGTKNRFFVLVLTFDNGVMEIVLVDKVELFVKGDGTWGEYDIGDKLWCDCGDNECVDGDPVRLLVASLLLLLFVICRFETLTFFRDEVLTFPIDDK